jgi:HD-GYP domain-containing protein (c-di-GMP phosphodiesterase class II)/signal transduction histidine kinase
MTAAQPQLTEKKLAILQEISSAVLFTDNIRAIANLMLDLAGNHLQADKGSLMLVNPRNELYILASLGFDEGLARTLRTPMGEGIAGTVAASRQAVLVTDIETDPRFAHTRRERYKTRSFISCPIIAKNRVLGVLNMHDKQDGTPFSEDEFALLKIIANQAALALQNAFLVNELKAKAGELEEVNRKLVDAAVAKTDFLTRVAHELRTPLNSIKGSTYLLQSSPLLPPEERREFLDIIGGETDKLIGIAEHQLSFLRLEDEGKLVHKTLLDLAATLRETVGGKSLQNLLTRRGIDLQLDLPPKLPTIAGDKILTVQLLHNLIEGALSGLPRGASLQLGARVEEFIILQLSSSAPFPPLLLNQVRGSNGLGCVQQGDDAIKLSLARKAAEVQGWSLSVDGDAAAPRVQLHIPKGQRQKKEAALTTTMDLFLEFIAEILDVSTCSIMLEDELTRDLTIRSARGLDDEVIKRTRVRLGERIAGYVAHQGEALLISDLEHDSRFGGIRIPGQYNTASLLCLPLKVEGRVVGVLNLNNKRSALPFTEQDLQIASALGDRVAHQLERLLASEEQNGGFRSFIGAFDALLGAERRYHKKHPRLPALVGALAEALGLSAAETTEALYASLIYDLGLMLIDDEVLHKEKPLSAAEASLLKVHPYITLDLLREIEISDAIRQGILHHHEHWDGSGYPDRLQGEAIPRLARLLAVADAYCAMTEERPQRPALPPAEALAELGKHSGLQFDPQMFAALAAILRVPNPALSLCDSSSLSAP